MGLEARELNDKRIIAEFQGHEPGPLVIIFGSMHGNEKGGVKAITYLSKMLEVEHITNPAFSFKGNILGIIGNFAAYERSERFIDIDINRHWSKEYINSIKGKDEGLLFAEDKEILGTLELINKAIAKFKPPKLYVLDLHTTSSDGGIFTIPSDDPESITISKTLHAPVITGMLDGIKGTTLHYFKSENFPVPTTSVTFEAGQHYDPISVNRAIAATINFMRCIGCVQSNDVENIHDEILINYSKQLPKVTELVLRHGIDEKDKFKMLPGFKNFQSISKDEILATDKNGEVLSPIDGKLLMPLYQPKGEDGFFIVKVVE